jgi:hypothetical protein
VRQIAAAPKSRLHIENAESAHHGSRRRGKTSMNGIATDARLSDCHGGGILAQRVSRFGRFYPFGADRLTTSGRFIQGTRVALTHRDASSMTARCDPLR